jgi:hypothetical protein
MSHGCCVIHLDGRAGYETGHNDDGIACPARKNYGSPDFYGHRRMWWETGVSAMATFQPRASTTGEAENDSSWTEADKQAWLAAHGGAPTHVVTFEPMYQIEVCIPPWEQPDRHIARSAVAWGKSMGQALDDDRLGAAAVVAAHHEGNSLEVSPTADPRPRLRSVS